jgi:hypothetical protein
MKFHQHPTASGMKTLRIINNAAALIFFETPTNNEKLPAVKGGFPVGRPWPPFDSRPLACA